MSPLVVHGFGEHGEDFMNYMNGPDDETARNMVYVKG